MESRGLHIALSADERDRLLACGDDAARLDFLDAVAAANWGGDDLLVTEGAWRELESCFATGPYPLNLALLGGRRVSDAIRLIEPHEVSDLAVALAPIDRVKLLVRYLKHAESGSPDYGEEAFEHAWVRFQYLRDFFARAAAGDQAVLFTLAE